MADHLGCVTGNHVIDAAWLATRGPGLTTVPYRPDLVGRRHVNGPTPLLRQPLWGMREVHVVNHSVADVWRGVPHDWMDLIGPDSLALCSNEASRPGDELHEGAGAVDVTDLWATVSFSRSGTLWHQRARVSEQAVYLSRLDPRSVEHRAQIMLALYEEDAVDAWINDPEDDDQFQEILMACE
jgi:hypothetical protein